MSTINLDGLNSPMQPIGVIESCFTEKFGVPRQPGLTPSATGRIMLREPFDRPEMFRGVEEFSHLWVVFLFHQAVAEGWKPTVRPPRLGGKQRRGVFATRSPHRPNHLGLSVVRLEEMVFDSPLSYLRISGIDMVDGTPVVDIKPYIAATDQPANSVPVPGEGVAEIIFSSDVQRFCRRYEASTGRRLHALIGEVLAQDPRPAGQRGSEKEFGMLLWDVNVRWRRQADGYLVTSCEQVDPPT
jgi:tRNA-Thr(GGU) m(6)t(6)A37 methyltransferase TsaA